MDESCLLSFFLLLFPFFLFPSRDNQRFFFFLLSNALLLVAYSTSFLSIWCSLSSLSHAVRIIVFFSSPFRSENPSLFVFSVQIAYLVLHSHWGKNISFLFSKFSRPRPPLSKIRRRPLFPWVYLQLLFQTARRFSPYFFFP